MLSSSLLVIFQLTYVQLLCTFLKPSDSSAFSQRSSLRSPASPSETNVSDVPKTQVGPKSVSVISWNPEHFVWKSEDHSFSVISDSSAYPAEDNENLQPLNSDDPTEANTMLADRETSTVAIRPDISFWRHLDLFLASDVYHCIAGLNITCFWNIWATKDRASAP